MSERETVTAGTDHDWSERIAAVHRILEERLDETVPIEELADAACASMFHFHRVFRGVTGETVRQYTRRLRLERAAHHLVHGENDILRIALDAGYDSHEAFTRAFKRHFGATPSTFRSERRDDRVARPQTPEDQHMDIHIETIGPRRIAFVRHVGPYNEVGEAWQTLMKWGWTKMMFGKPDTFGLCFDDPEVTPPERLRYEACMVVGDRVKPKGEIQVKTLPEQTYAMTRHDGPLEMLSETYAALVAQLVAEPVEGRRWQLAEPPSLERYLCDPRKVEPADMRTEVCMPVQR